MPAVLTPSRALTLSLLLALLALAMPAWAQSVGLHGTMGTRALLTIDGGAPKALVPGDTHHGVTLVSTAAGEAVIEIGGRRQTLRVGEAPVSIGGGGAPPRGTRIVLTAGSNGHFTGIAAVNGRTLPFLVDTGASVVALSAGDADRIGLNYRAGRPVQVNTANGSTTGWRLKLGSVRIGDVEAHEVDAVVTPQSMPHILLGNSFLIRFQMKRENEQMVLERRY
ncbi:TIGR02281 family clan AA aspartic protease [Ramlibacter sp. AN1015]|uniref:retropepsin-like aspartic protease family protein n=1 Tax=Ramlibacter sp. AN1015 TaxID=3133428 RepID=UPI0030C3F0D1